MYRGQRRRGAELQAAIAWPWHGRVWSAPFRWHGSTCRSTKPQMGSQMSPRGLRHGLVLGNAVGLSQTFGHKQASSLPRFAFAVNNRSPFLARLVLHPRHMSFQRCCRTTNFPPTSFDGVSASHIFHAHLTCHLGVACRSRVPMFGYSISPRLPAGRPEANGGSKRKEEYSISGRKSNS